MKRGVLIFLSLAACCMQMMPRGAMAKKSVRSPEPLDIAMEIDSVNWLRERYCDMLAYDPGRADGTLCRLKNKFARLPQNVRDSLLATHYENIVTLFEQERNTRAYAFSDCYYALAQEDDANLGSLYLNDIVLAIEELDSVKLRSRISLLERYAARNNLDYDKDLAEAENNMRLIRHTIAFKQAPFADFCGKGMWVVDPGFFQEADVEWFGFIPFGIELETFQGSRGIGCYSPTFGKLHVNKGGAVLEPAAINFYGFDIDEKTKTVYGAWGNEKTQSANPRLLAGGRQTVQDTHAMVSGELARKKYSYGERLGGELAVTVVDIGLNALFDWLSVTTVCEYRCEISLTMTKPDLLEGVLMVATSVARSNALDKAERKMATIPLRYYRTYPEYGKCSMNKGRPVFASFMSDDSYRALADVFAQEVKLRKKKWEVEHKEWKKKNKDAVCLDKFEDQYNADILYNLRENSENSLMTHPLTQPK